MQDYRLRWWFSIQTWQWSKTLSTQYRSDFRTSLWMSLRGPARAMTWTWLNVFGQTRQECINDASYATLKRLKHTAGRNGRGSSNPAVPSWQNQIHCQWCFHNELRNGSGYLCKWNLLILLNSFSYFVLMYYVYKILWELFCAFADSWEKQHTSDS